jgi:type I restriction enzyme R subunit
VAYGKNIYYFNCTYLRTFSGELMLDEKEWQTRKERIDTKLKSLSPSWQIISYKADMDLINLTCHAVTEYPTENGPADYALFIKEDC